MFCEKTLKYKLVLWKRSSSLKYVQWGYFQYRCIKFCKNITIAMFNHTRILRQATQLITFKHSVKVLQPTLRKLQSSWEATARASSVLPVPGGPYNKQPFGGLIPTRWKSSGFRRGSSITCNSNKDTFQTKGNQQQGGGWRLGAGGFP